MRLFVHKRHTQWRRATGLAAVGVILLVLSGLFAGGVLRAADDATNATVPAFRAYLPAIRLDPTPTVTPVPFPQLVNGSLEQGPGVGWTESPATLIYPTSAIPDEAQAGASSSYVAWLGSDTGTQMLAQKVFIPYTYGFQVRLKLYAFTKSEESNCNNDTANLYLAESSAPLWSWPLCKGKATNAWQQYTIDLSGYGGKEIDLRFISRLNGAGDSSWFLNRLELCQIGAPGC
jgi:hypothetical protein